MADFFLDKQYLPPDPNLYPANESLLGRYLTDWCKSLEKPLVLLLDEVDALYDDALISTLRQLRDGSTNTRRTPDRHFPTLFLKKYMNIPAANPG